jgi:hypothetical protein
MTHALADFYAHSNWIELQFAAQVSPGPAPLVSLGCDPAALAAALQTGYFSLGSGLDGCPGTFFGGPAQPS